MHTLQRWLVAIALSLLLAAPAAAQQVIKFATLAPEGTTWVRELRAAAVEVQAGTQGRVQIKLYPGGVMGGDAVVLRKLRLGQLQGGMLTASELSVVNPDANAYSLPFLFRDWAQVERVRPLLDPLLIRGFEARGLRMLASSSIGFAYLMSATPIRTMADLRTHKLWVPPNDAIAAMTLHEIGASPIPLPLGDVFTSLQTGMIDTITNTPASTIVLQWHGKLRYLVDVPVVFVVGYVVMDDKVWNKLAPADQAVLASAMARASRRTEAKAKQDDVGALAALQKSGLSVTRLDPAEAARWREAGARVQRRMEGEQQFSPEVMAALRRASAGPAASSPGR